MTWLQLGQLTRARRKRQDRKQISASVRDLSLGLMYGCPDSCLCCTPRYLSKPTSEQRATFGTPPSGD